MMMCRMTEMFAIVPVTMLLTVSFFVLYTARKAEAQSLKMFGFVVAVLLWVSATFVFSAGLFGYSSRSEMMSMKHCGMKGKQRMQKMQMQAPIAPAENIQQQK